MNASTFLSRATIAVALLMTTAFAADDVEGVKAGLTRIAKDKDNAGVADKITVSVGDKIEIDWTYPVVPGSIPKKVGARSDAGSVKFNEILRITHPKIVGSGELGAFFTAEKVGKAVLNFDIKTGDEKGVILKVEVEVVAP